MPEAELSNYIRTHRKRAHLTQGEVAFLLGKKSTAGVCRHELFRQKPSLEYLLAYEILFSTPVRSLFNEAKESMEIRLKNQVQILMDKLTKSKPDRIGDRKLEFLRAVLQYGR